ncbi:MAG: Gfo/Idh/MocA family oxidoreductase [Syntrophales bacterium]|nr:Gfo/Idh/MocA family oxidoreductase [Syntrophales bacterium]MDD5642143.1 Gfo/Idh/MocA family oxidoreductase [Syntrophales bacterium]
MSQPLKVGVIGVGYLGRFHAEKYAALPDVDLVGVADLNPDQAAQVAGALNTRGFPDYLQLLPLVEAVSVAVSTTAHFPVVRDCLERGLQVLVEKPLAVTAAEADTLVDLARDKGRLLMVGHLERFNSAMEELRAKVTRPAFIESHRLSFYKERGIDVDVVLDLMIHDLDHVLSLVPSPVQEIRAAGVSVLTDKVDLANVRLEFADGCIANLTASRMSFKSMRKFRLFQPDAYLSVDFEARELTMASRQEGALGPLPGVALETKRFPQEDVLFKEISNFVAAIQGREEPRVTGEDGRAALSLALDIIGAMRKAKV